MFTKKSFWVSLILCLELASCKQTMSVSVYTQDKRIAGHIQSQIVVSPILAKYLKNLDQFSGIENPTEELPSAFLEVLAYYKQTQKNYKQKINYNKQTGCYSIDCSFDFLGIETLFPTSTQTVFLPLLSVTQQDKLTTITVLFNNTNRPVLENAYPFLIPLPEQRNAKTQKAYFNELAQLLAESSEEITQAEKELQTAILTLQVTTQQPLVEIVGGKIVNKARTQAVFEIPLKEVIFLQQDQKFSLTF